MKIRLLLSLVMAFALASAASAQKLSGTLQCDKADPMHSLEAGDAEKHSMSVAKYSCTWTKPMDIGGTKTKAGANVEFADTTGMTSNSRGVHWGTTEDGSQYFVRYTGTATSNDGAPPTMSGTWSFTGGAAKLKGLTGKGTYKGKGNPDESATFEILGTYKLP